MPITNKMLVNLEEKPESRGEMAYRSTGTPQCG